MSLTTPTKPTIFLDADFLGHLFEGKNGFNEQLGNAVLDGLKQTYDIKITDQVYAEATRDLNFPTDKAILDWFTKEQITPIHTDVHDEIVAGGDTTDAGERSIIEVIDRPENSGIEYKIASDDAKYFNPLNPNTPGKVYVDNNKVLPIQQATEELLNKGHLNILDYNGIAANNEGLNSSRSWIPKFLTPAQAVVATPVGKANYTTDANGELTDIKTGNKVTLGEVFKNLIIDESGSSGTLAGVAELVGMDAASLENAILHGTVGLSGVALGGLGIVAMTHDILNTAEEAGAKLNRGDVAGAIASVEALAGRTGLGIAGAEAGYAMGIGIGGMLAEAGIIAAGGPAVIAAGLIVATAGAITGAWTGTQLVNALNKAIEPLAHALADYIDKNWPGFGDSLLTIGDTLGAAYDSFLHAVKLALHIDPLIIDLNGNGIALNSWQASTTLFDLNGDGTKEHTGWTKANGDDAFLVIDKNNDGKINDITEMFGNASTPGFAELRNYDSNKDGVINASDSQFNLLRLWNDKNANGVVDSGEMTTLAANDNAANELKFYLYLNSK